MTSRRSRPHRSGRPARLRPEVDEAPHGARVNDPERSLTRVAPVPGRAQPPPVQASSLWTRLVGIVDAETRSRGAASRVDQLTWHPLTSVNAIA